MGLLFALHPKRATAKARTAPTRPVLTRTAALSLAGTLMRCSRNIRIIAPRARRVSTRALLWALIRMLTYDARGGGRNPGSTGQEICAGTGSGDVMITPVQTIAPSVQDRSYFDSFILQLFRAARLAKYDRLCHTTSRPTERIRRTRSFNPAGKKWFCSASRSRGGQQTTPDVEKAFQWLKARCGRVAWK